MKVFYSDHFLVPLPQNHRFPMPKYARLRQRVLESGLIASQDWQPSEAASDEQLMRVHEPEYLEKLVRGSLSDKEMRRIGFPWSAELVERSRRSVGGTIGACRAALLDEYAANLAGGTHHAYPDHGEGFCVFNDVAVAARAMQAESRANRVVILDLDVHQGNGTAAVFAQDSSVYTLSVHGAKNFPFHKEVSDLDIPLPDGCQDEQFLQAVRSGVERAVEQARADLAIYIAGADPYSNDQLGRLKVTKAGLAERDKIVLHACRKAILPVAIVMGGGYAKDIAETVEIHLQTIRIAVEMGKKGETPARPITEVST
jgi:acetoin utilization deacetylase AcuC-like enzyme